MNTKRSKAKSGQQQPIGFGAQVKMIMREVAISKPGKIKMRKLPDSMLWNSVVDLSKWNFIVADSDILRLQKIVLSGVKCCFLDMTASSIESFLHPLAQTTLNMVSNWNITHLNLSNCKLLSNKSLEYLVPISSQLVFLDLTGLTTITDGSLREVLYKAVNIETLILDECSSITGRCFLALSQESCKFSSVRVCKCTSLENWAIQRLFHVSSNLKSLHMTHIEKLTDEELHVLSASPCKLTMQVLDISYCPRISDDGIISISQGCTNIRTISMIRNKIVFKITDSSMMAMGSLTGLSHMNLSGCEVLTDIGVSWLVCNGGSITHLDLSGCKELTNASLRVIGSFCPNLESIDLSNVPSIRDIGIRALAQGLTGGTLSGITSTRCKLTSIRLKALCMLSDGQSGLTASNICITDKNKIQYPEEDVADEISVIDQGVVGFLKLCGSGLRVLDLTGCFRLGRNVTASIYGNCENLRHLVLKGLQSEYFVNVPSKCRQLSYLNLDNCTSAVDNSVLREIGQYLVNLTSLSIENTCPRPHGGSSSDSNGGWWDVEHGLKHVICGCLGLDESVAIYIADARYCRHINNIEFDWCRNFGDVGMFWLGTGCSQTLTNISLSHTTVSRSGLHAVADNFPYCEIVTDANKFGFFAVDGVDEKKRINSFHELFTSLYTLQTLVKKKCRRLEMERERMKILELDSAIEIQKLVRGYQAKCRLEKKRNELRTNNKASLIITGFFRVLLARKRFATLMANKEVIRYMNAVSKVQKFWRGMLGKKLFLINRKEKRRILNLKSDAAKIIQAAYSSYCERRHFRLVKQAKSASLRIRTCKCLLLQRCIRGMFGRKQASECRKVQAAVNLKKNMCSTRIKRMFLCRKLCRKVEMQVRRRQLKLSAALRLQCVLRSRLARIRSCKYMLIRKAEIEEGAAMLLQCLFRGKIARNKADYMRRLRENYHEMRHMASILLQRYVRRFVARRQKKALKKIRDEKIRRRVELEYWASTKVQSVWRGITGRRKYSSLHLNNRLKWKELYDDSRQRAFFYNQLTGETRWRRPWVLLQLLPVPICDNCKHLESFMECLSCNEFFCQYCWRVVHFGGKRAQNHKFRCMFDYYGKRIDYGDGEFPSIWPSELQQDELNGWILRVYPNRMPEKSINNWDQYCDEDTAVIFYHNRSTNEYSYVKPVEMFAATDLTNKRPLLIKNESLHLHIDDETGDLFWFDNDTAAVALARPMKQMNESPHTEFIDASRTQTPEVSSPVRRRSNGARFGAGSFMNDRSPWKSPSVLSMEPSYEAMERKQIESKGTDSETSWAKQWTFPRDVDGSRPWLRNSDDRRAQSPCTPLPYLSLSQDYSGQSLEDVESKQQLLVLPSLQSQELYPVSCNELQLVSSASSLRTKPPLSKRRVFRRELEQLRTGKGDEEVRQKREQKEQMYQEWKQRKKDRADRKRADNDE